MDETTKCTCNFFFFFLFSSGKENLRFISFGIFLICVNDEPADSSNVQRKAIKGRYLIR